MGIVRESKINFAIKYKSLKEAEGGSRKAVKNWNKKFKIYKIYRNLFPGTCFIFANKSVFTTYLPIKIEIL